MKTSDQVTEIFAALVKAQGEITNAKKKAENPEFNSMYADLASIIDVAKKPLADNDLAVLQSPSTVENRIEITGRIIHKSGQWVEDTLTFKMTKKDPQSVGSVITYGRRYQLSAFLGIAQEDDDANSASRSVPRTPQGKKGRAERGTRANSEAPIQIHTKEPTTAGSESGERVLSASAEMQSEKTPLQKFQAAVWFAKLTDDEAKQAVFSVVDCFDYKTVKDAITASSPEVFQKILVAISETAKGKEIDKEALANA